MTRRKSAARPSYVESSSEADEELAPVKKRLIEPNRDSSASVNSLSEDDDSGSRVSSDDIVTDDESPGDSDAASANSLEQKKKKIRLGKRQRTQSLPERKVAKTAAPFKAIALLPATSANTATIAKTEQEDSEAEEGVIFIPKLPALPAGDIDYTDGSIHPNTISFLLDLRSNNERSWFQQRDLQYQAAKTDFDTFILALASVITSHDPTIPALPAKDLTFRIYRDIRFSNDRTPYKTFLAAYFSRSGRKGPWAGYYFSLEPGDKTLLAAGLWQPPAPDLLLVRQSIDAEPERWRQVLDSPEFKEFFHGRQGLLETKDCLKTCPKGFSKEHEDIDLLRLKSFTVSMTFKDDEVVDANFMTILGAVVQQMEPFVTMLNDIIRPDELDE